MDQLQQMLSAILNRLERLEKGLIIKKFTIPSDGYFVPKVLTSDPVTPQTNEVWINKTTNLLKWYDGTTTHTLTFT